MKMKRIAGAAVLLAGTLAAAPAAAQKDYYNTDRNRPVRIEDAYTTERYALELKLAPLRLERESGGAYHWGFEPEIGFGVLPRTSIELGLPIAFVDGSSEARGERTSGLAGIEVGVFYNLNHETRTLPALAVRLDAILPVGPLAPDRTYPSVTGIATRTFPWARFHGNAQYTFGSAPAVDAPAGAHELSRWLAGVAVDRAFPLDSWLLIAELYAQQPLHADDPVAWSTGGGIRYQVSPYLTVDAGLGRRLGAGGSWYVTVGSAYHVGVRSLMPRVR
jgi:hypothetical protein